MFKRNSHKLTSDEDATIEFNSHYIEMSRESPDISDQIYVK